MSLIAAASDLVKAVTTDRMGFAVAIMFTAPGDNPGEPVEVSGIPVRHNLNVDMRTGNTVSSLTARIAVHRDELVAKGLPTNIKGYKISWTDIGTGVANNYKITETMPGDTVGMIVCLLNRTN